MAPLEITYQSLGSYNLVHIGSGNGLLIDGTKPFPGPIFIYARVGVFNVCRRVVSQEKRSLVIVDYVLNLHI